MQTVVCSIAADAVCSLSGVACRCCFPEEVSQHQHVPVRLMALCTHDEDAEDLQKCTNELHARLGRLGPRTACTVSRRRTSQRSWCTCPAVLSSSACWNTCRADCQVRGLQHGACPEHLTQCNGVHVGRDTAGCIQTVRTNRRPCSAGSSLASGFRATVLCAALNSEMPKPCLAKP